MDASSLDYIHLCFLATGRPANPIGLVASACMPSSAAPPQIGDAGSVLAGWRNKCFQCAAIAATPRPFRPALRTFLLRSCANHERTGWSGNLVAVNNLIAIANGLASLSLWIGVVFADS